MFVVSGKTSEVKVSWVVMLCSAAAGHPTFLRTDTASSMMENKVQMHASLWGLHPRLHGPPECCYPTTPVHSVTTQKTMTWIFIVKTWNLTQIADVWERGSEEEFGHRGEDVVDTGENFIMKSIITCILHKKINITTFYFVCIFNIGW